MEKGFTDDHFIVHDHDVHLFTNGAPPSYSMNAYRMGKLKIKELPFPSWLFTLISPL